MENGRRAYLAARLFFAVQMLNFFSVSGFFTTAFRRSAGAS
jgi:hypothetical protein